MGSLGSSAVPAASQPWHGPKAFPTFLFLGWSGDRAGHPLGDFSVELLEDKRGKSSSWLPGDGFFPQPDSAARGVGGRGCWSLLERQICNLATGSEAAKPRQGLQRAARYPSRAAAAGTALLLSRAQAAKAASTPCSLLCPPQPGPAKPSLAAAARD